MLSRRFRIPCIRVLVFVLVSILLFNVYLLLLLTVVHRLDPDHEHDLLSFVLTGCPFAALLFWLQGKLIPRWVEDDVERALGLAERGDADCNA